jgi:hypothetical protein
MKEKRNLLLLAVCSAIIIVACYKNQKADKSVRVATNISSPVSTENASLADQPAFSKYAGTIFPGDTITSWINNYTKQKGTTSKPANFKVNDISSLYSTADAAGVMFYKVDFSSGPGIIALGVDTNGKIIKTGQVMSSNGIVDWQQALDLEQAYQQANPNGLWGEFFGKNSLENFISRRLIQTLHVQSGVTGKGIRLVLTNGSETTYSDGMDDGQICPPVCPPKSN